MHARVETGTGHPGHPIHRGHGKPGQTQIIKISGSDTGLALTVLSWYFNILALALRMKAAIFLSLS